MESLAFLWRALNQRCDHVPRDGAFGRRSVSSHTEVGEHSREPTWQFDPFARPTFSNTKAVASPAFYPQTNPYCAPSRIRRKLMDPKSA